MGITVSGIIHGRRIDLDQEASPPDGAPVVVQIEPRDLSLKEREILIACTAGAWAGDPSLERLLDDLGRQRTTDPGRRISFDDPA